MNRIDVHKQVINHHGWVNQFEKLSEELREFDKEIWNYLDNERNIKELISEFADVLNMIEQFEIIVKEKKMFTHLDIDKEQNRKMEREINRINNK